MEPRPTEAPSLSPCEPGTDGTGCGCLRQQMAWNKCLCARKALSLSLLGDDDFSHMQESLWHSKAGRNFPGKSHREPFFIVWPKEVQDSLEEGREVHSQALEKQGSSRVSSLPTESVCILLLLLLTLQPQCTPAPRAGSVPDWGSYYKILARTQRERDGGFKVR